MDVKKIKIYFPRGLWRIYGYFGTGWKGNDLS